MRLSRAASLRAGPRHRIAGVNARAHDMRIDGFPILWFDNAADRERAHISPEMAACNVDSRLFIGAVSRVICEPGRCCRGGAEARMKLIAVLPGQAADDVALEHYAAWARSTASACRPRAVSRAAAGARTEQHHPASAGEHGGDCRTGIRQPGRPGMRGIGIAVGAAHSRSTRLSNASSASPAVSPADAGWCCSVRAPAAARDQHEAGEPRQLRAQSA